MELSPSCCGDLRIVEISDGSVIACGQSMQYPMQNPVENHFNTRQYVSKL
jgi:hypothetical protein